MPRRIAMVGRRVWPAHGPGGAERPLRDLALQLARAGLAIDLISETPREPERRRAAEATFGDRLRLIWSAPGRLPIGRARGTVVLDRITNYPWWVRRLPRYLTPDVDLVYATGLTAAGFVPEHAGRRAPRALVHVPHGMEEFRSPGLKRLAYAPFRAGVRAAAAAADIVLANDAALRTDTRVLLDLPEDRVEMIPNAFDGDALRDAADIPAARALLARHRVESSPVLVSIGRIAPNKGFELLATALAREASRLPSGWHWVLVGEGPYRGRVEAAIRTGRIVDRCHLVGSVSDAVKHGLLECGDWFVHPTRFEGSSLVTLEAMTHGLPVLGTRAGGVPDKVIEGETGILVEPGDVEALQKGLLDAARSDATVFGAASRRLFDRRFDWRVVLPGYLELFCGILERRARAAPGS